MTGERAASDVSCVGVPRHDGAVAAVDSVTRRAAPARGALGERDRVELAGAGAAARHHDVLPRLRHRTLVRLQPDRRWPLGTCYYTNL